MFSSKLPTLGFLIVLTLAAFRAYQYPSYTSDQFEYMANAVAMRGASIQVIHGTVYREVLTKVPRNLLDHLLGNDPMETAGSRSFHERAVNPYSFAEYLPCFAVRPVYNELVYVLHYWLGVGLLQATVLIAVGSYWLLGCIVLAWISRYIAGAWGAVVAILLMLTPPVWDLARWPMPDSLSCMALLLALYLILERNLVVVGMAILLGSVYIRTDNVLLVLTVLGYLAILNKTIDKVSAAVLAAVAVGSVLLINHFAGDYGARLLYYRAFIGPPLAPGEFVASFGFHDYLAAFRLGVAVILHGAYSAFALMGLVGLLLRPGRAAWGLAVIASVYGVGRFVVFPLVDERYFGMFFLAMGIVLAAAVGTRMISVRGTSERGA